MHSVSVVLRRSLNAVLAPTLLLFLTGYFIWNTLHGAHGITAYQTLLQTRQQAEKALQEAHQEQDIWHRRVEALSEASLDTDMLDERSRAMLNSSREGDIVVPYGKHGRLY